MPSEDQAFHTTVKPSWASDGTLVYAIPGSAQNVNDALLTNVQESVVAEGKDVRFARVVPAQDVSNLSTACQEPY